MVISALAALATVIVSNHVTAAATTAEAGHTPLATHTAHQDSLIQTPTLQTAPTQLEIQK